MALSADDRSRSCPPNNHAIRDPSYICKYGALALRGDFLFSSAFFPFSRSHGAERGGGTMLGNPALRSVRASSALRELCWPFVPPHSRPSLRARPCAASRAGLPGTSSYTA
jgi:hypothetical protein